MSYFQIVKVLFQLSSTLSAPELYLERGFRGEVKLRSGPTPRVILVCVRS